MPAGTESWYNDFYELSTDRQSGMCLGQIPAASIDRRTADMTDEDATMFRAVIRAMDKIYLRHQRGEPDAPEESDNPKRDAFRLAMTR